MSAPVEPATVWAGAAVMAGSGGPESTTVTPAAGSRAAGARRQPREGGGRGKAGRRRTATSTPTPADQGTGRVSADERIAAAVAAAPPLPDDLRQRLWEVLRGHAAQANDPAA